MSLFSRIAGVFGTLFQIGGATGPAIKNNSGNIDARNSSDSAYVNVRGLDPVITQDFVTKNYGDNNYIRAFSINTIAVSTVLTITSGNTMLQAGDLDIEGDLDISVGDVCWVD